MSNVIPKSEGYITPEVYEAARKEIRDVFLPLVDGFQPMTDGISIGVEALGAVNHIKGLPVAGRERTLVLLSILGSIVDEVQKDLVIIYPEEV